MLSGTRPTDDLWLTAHDGVGVRKARVISARPLGIGLATGLLTELVHGGWCQLWEGRLFRTEVEPLTGKAVKPPKDFALQTLLDQMQVDEQDWPLPKPQRSRTYRAAHSLPPQIGDYWPPEAQAAGGSPPVPKETKPSGPGHDPREYMTWLAYEDRAVRLVGDRLARIGLVQREEERRRFRGGTTVRYVPYNTVLTGNPANQLTGAVQHWVALDWSRLFYAELLFVTGLHQHALFGLTPSQHHGLRYLLKKGLEGPSRELLDVAEVTVKDAAGIR